MTDLLAQSLDYRAFIRGKPCLVHGEACGQVQACHVKRLGTRSPRRLVSFRHFTMVPLCGELHEEQEGATMAFNIKYDMDLSSIAHEFFIEFLTGTPQPWFRDKG